MSRRIYSSGAYFPCDHAGNLPLDAYFFALAGTDENAVRFMEDYLKPVVGEDKFATEEIEKMLKIIGENPSELRIKADRNAVEARRMLQAMMDAKRDDAPAIAAEQQQPVA